MQSMLLRHRKYGSKLTWTTMRPKPTKKYLPLVLTLPNFGGAVMHLHVAAHQCKPLIILLISCIRTSLYEIYEMLVSIHTPPIEIKEEEVSEGRAPKIRVI